MNLLFLIPDHEYGGEERRSYTIFKNLKENHNCYFITSETKFTFTTTEYKKLPNGLFSFFTSFIFIYKFINDNNIDVVFLFKRKMGVYGFFLEKILPNVKFVFNVANVWPEKKYLNFFTPSYLTALSNKLFEQYDVDSKKLTEVIPIGNDLVIDDSDSLMNNSSDYKKLTLFNLGKLNYQKNHDFLIDIAISLKKHNIDCEIHIAGEGELRINLEKRIVKEGLKNVILHGHVKNVAEFIRDKHAYIQTSNFEGFPNALLEAAKFRKPIIANRVGATEDFIDSTSGYLINELNVELYIDSIQTLIGKPEEAVKRAEVAHNRAYNIYTVKNMILGYEKFLQNIR